MLLTCCCSEILIVLFNTQLKHTYSCAILIVCMTTLCLLLYGIVIKKLSKVKFEKNVGFVQDYVALLLEEKLFKHIRMRFIKLNMHFRCRKYAYSNTSKFHFPGKDAFMTNIILQHHRMLLDFP